MNDEQAAEVQAALDAILERRKVGAYDRMHNVLDDIDTLGSGVTQLLAERQRLRAIEDLAREWCSLYGVNAESAQADVMDRLRKALGME